MKAEPRQGRADSGGKGARRRQEFFYRLARRLLLPYFSRRFNTVADPQPDLPGPCVIVSNHVTELDFFLTGQVFSEPMGFVVGEGLLRSRLMRFILIKGFGCIAKQKGTADPRTAMGMLRRLREGRNVCLYAEGNTTFDGRTSEIPSATGSLLRAVNAGLVVTRIEGAYFAMPRWGRGIRRGKTRCRVAGVYTAQELAGMTDGEVNTLLNRLLYTDAYAGQEREMIPYRGKNLAGGIHHVLYLCPECLSQGTVVGEGESVRCTACGMKTIYTPTGFFKDRMPFPGIRDWADWQKDSLRGMLDAPEEQPVLQDDRQTLLEMRNGRFVPAAKGTLALRNGVLEIGGYAFPLADLPGLEIYRKNVLQFSLPDGRRFQTRPGGAFNTLKYRDAYRIIREQKG